MLLQNFPNYSLNNSILIKLQKPDSSLVNSYSGWQRLGRNVKRGEKGIAIWAPMPVKVKSEQVKVDENGDAVLQPDGTPAKDIKELKVVRVFRIEHTFDISQTEVIPGKNAPDLNVVTELTGSYDNYNELMKAICDVSPVPIEYENIKDGSRGYFSPTENRIAIKEGLPQQSAIEVVCHELGHACMHSQKMIQQRKEKGLSELSTAEKELEAESVSYIISSHYGIDTSIYSFGYAGSWLTGYDKNIDSENVNQIVRQHLQTIKDTSSALINKIDKQLELQHSEIMHEEKQNSFDRDARNISKRISDFAEKFTPSSFAQHELYEGAYAEQIYRHLKSGDSRRIATSLDSLADDSNNPDCRKEAMDLSEKISQFSDTYQKEIEETPTKKRALTR